MNWRRATTRYGQTPAPATPSAGNSGQPVQETIQLMPLNLNPEDDSHDEASVAGDPAALN